MVCEFFRQKRKSWKLIMVALGPEREWRKGMGRREVLTHGQQTLEGSSCVTSWPHFLKGK